MSKGLEALESIRQDLIKYENNPILFDDYGKQILGIGANKDIRFDELEKELKALEIIIEKLGNRITLQRFFTGYVLILNDGDIIINLTQEEYDLLKEVLV